MDLLTGGIRPELVVVGLGLKPSHITHEAREAIEDADVVMSLAASPLAQELVNLLAKSVVSLNEFYQVGLDRSVTYERMAARIVEEVVAGRKVCLAVYGHPGIYCLPAQLAIKQARELGFTAVMYPGISAEDALFADLGIDPAGRGCQSYEATHFLVTKKAWDPTSWLVLWQIGTVGEGTYQAGKSNPGLPALCEKLSLVYGPSHIVTTYYAYEVPHLAPLVTEVPLGSLSTTEFPPLATLVVPPCGEEIADSRTVESLNWLILTAPHTAAQ